jgi:hypothetical protein
MTFVWGVLIAGLAVSVVRAQEKLPVEKVFDLPASVLTPTTTGVSIQISSDQKYVFATVVDVGTSVPARRATTLVWTYPDGKLVKEASIYLEPGGAIGNHILYESDAQRLVYFEKNAMCVSPLAEPEGKTVRIKLQPEFCTFDRYTVWRAADGKGVMHYGFCKAIGGLPSTLVGVPLDPAQKQTKFVDPPIREVTFAGYSKRSNSLLVSERDKDQHRARIWSITDNQVRDFPARISAPVTSCAFHDDGNKVIVGLESGDLTVANLARQTAVNYRGAASFRISDVCLLDDKHLVACSLDAKSILTLFDFDGGKVLKRYGRPKAMPDTTGVSMACCAAHGTRILYAILARKKVLVGSLALPISK